MDNDNFGFNRSGNVAVDEYQSSIDINFSGGNLPLEPIVLDAAENIAYRANRLRQEKGWPDSYSVVLTLTIAPGAHKQSEMSLQQVR